MRLPVRTQVALENGHRAFGRSLEMHGNAPELMADGAAIVSIPDDRRSATPIALSCRVMDRPAPSSHH